MFKTKIKSACRDAVRKLSSFVDLNSAGLLQKYTDGYCCLPNTSGYWSFCMCVFVEMYVKSMKLINVKYNQNICVSGQCGTIVPKYI